MRKLDAEEEFALRLLREYQSYCPPRDATGDALIFTGVLERLTKKKRVRIEPTDDGPRYHPL